MVDALTLQYYVEADPVKAAFGHELSWEDWLKLHSIADTFSDMLFTRPLVCVNFITDESIAHSAGIWYNKRTALIDFYVVCLAACAATEKHDDYTIRALRVWYNKLKTQRILKI